MTMDGGTLQLSPVGRVLKNRHLEVPAKPDSMTVLPVPRPKIGDGELIDENSEARTILSLEDGNFPPSFELLEGMGRPISDRITDAANRRGLLKPEIVRGGHAWAGVVPSDHSRACL